MSLIYTRPVKLPVLFFILVMLPVTVIIVLKLTKRI